MKFWQPGRHGLSALAPMALRPALSDGLPFSERWERFSAGHPVSGVCQPGLPRGQAAAPRGVLALIGIPPIRTVNFMPGSGRPEQNIRQR